MLPPNWPVDGPAHQYVPSPMCPGCSDGQVNPGRIRGSLGWASGQRGEAIHHIRGQGADFAAKVSLTLAQWRCSRLGDVPCCGCYCDPDWQGL
ncbi:hypothetical protein VFPPC_18099 [Pochonia chlamydosporia 170]|uniref:Uncharacterized protein n=1 Tax=Pochonia chlamydosporia 170 TaxID=1380566 RepID=A0A219APD9_METCM|nr:hypothetical protein VFPPC_18099 [Pochonia chlamydosporia 170]OWT42686.1 hypothetical protein VFPPC_18099 [Pochonia chlamydosporia 170]